MGTGPLLGSILLFPIVLVYVKHVARTAPMGLKDGLQPYFTSTFLPLMM